MGDVDAVLDERGGDAQLGGGGVDRGAEGAPLGDDVVLGDGHVVLPGRSSSSTGTWKVRVLYHCCAMLSSVLVA